MAIFTSPVTLNNGADHVYTFMGQKLDPKSMVSTWAELSDMTKDSKFTRKSDRSKKTVVRELVSVNKNLVKLDSTYAPCIINLTAMFHPEHTEADVTAQIKLVKAMLADANFASNLFRGQI